MSEIIIYTTKICPYCVKAKALLKRKNVTFQEIDVSNDLEMREKMTELAGGRKTVPQIFINNIHVGGCDDLYVLEEKGQLDKLLNS